MEKKDYFLIMGLILLTTVCAVSLWLWHQSGTQLAAAKTANVTALSAQKKKVNELEDRLAAAQAAAVKTTETVDTGTESDRKDAQIQLDLGGVATRFIALLQADTHDVDGKRKKYLDVATPELTEKLIPGNLQKQEKQEIQKNIYTVSFAKNQAMVDATNPDAPTVAVYMEYTLSTDKSKTPQHYVALLQFEKDKVADYRFFNQSPTAGGGAIDNHD
ncbi:hypothetical protein [Schleiferilactobacillus harbinensis]|jgi:hypothetical protein|uniref:Uncharacterized protein n=1 Tax=Schleiferilactobacillus harbinensis DSM 16991 TaxID=1122147 RepID=A0A0R1XDJ8_9LACO|nr:hypothetical protein [Schleiferilactobacillus harbinensis]KRM25155.1 hypothetical protein FC91_GL001093 [Schleiferilactobacillus harbinensis DSM 16991]